MKKICVITATLGLIAVSFFPVRAQDAAADSEQWPHVMQSGNITFKVYQPQLDAWDGFTLKAHSALAAQKGADENQVSYGVESFTVNTIVDKETRQVAFENVRIERVTFPSESDQEQAYLADLRAGGQLQMKGMSLDRLEADLAIVSEQQKGQSQQLRNTPPRIIFSSMPSILIYIDGAPVFTAVQGTGLSRAVNTQVLLLKDTAGKFYLHVFDGYMETTDLTGKWTVSGRPPADAQKAAEVAVNAQQTDLLEGEPDPNTNAKPSLQKGQVPRVYVSLAPAELIVTDGEPNYVPLQGTNLLYVSNTTANVFKDLDDQKSYVLISGRWFRASSNNGPWEYVSGKDLPKDFANIPDTTSKENVKASVPGTEQSQEALIANSIPTTTKVDRKTVDVPVQIDGEPQLRQIEGTPLQYVFNCSIPVIKLDARTWYAVYNGVWYVATGVGGPWAVADSVPAVIYSIPASSPLHYVTYVKVYNATPDYVYVGYTPGYYGTVISPDGTVVYGTGYLYPGYIGRHVWFSPIVTYGYGCDLRWTPWYGWSFGFGFGWGYPGFWCYPPAPYWGPFFIERHYFHRRFASWGASTSVNVYHHVPAGSLGVHQSSRFGQAYNSRTGARIVGHAAAVENVFRGVGPASVNRGGGVSHVPQGGVRGVPAVPSVNRGTVQRGGNVFGTREGHVYYYEPGGRQWRHLNPSRGVRHAAPPTAMPLPERGAEADHLNRARAAREFGNNRANSFQSNQPPEQPGVPHIGGGEREGGGGGGVMHGGGGRWGR
jgi:hypothetical protein